MTNMSKMLCKQYFTVLLSEQLQEKSEHVQCRHNFYNICIQGFVMITADKSDECICIPVGINLKKGRRAPDDRKKAVSSNL